MRVRFPLIALALAIVSSCSSIGPASSPVTAGIDALRARLLDSEGPVMVVAHRACFAEGAPENSLAAIELCVALGADMIEIDVALSAEGVPVLMHDRTLDRMTQAAGPVSDYEVSELVKLRLRAREGGVSEPLTRETIPTLREALERANGRILVNLDVKGDAYGPAFEIVRTLNMGDQIIMKMAANPDDPSLVDAPFHGKTHFMPVIRQCTEDTRQGACAPVLSAVVEEYDRFDPIAYEITLTDLGYLTEGVPAMKANDKRIWVNTLEPRHAAGLVDDNALIDPDAVWGVLVNLGVDMIQTDNPRELIAYLRTRGLRN